MFHERARILTNSAPGYKYFLIKWGQIKFSPPEAGGKFDLTPFLQKKKRDGESRLNITTKGGWYILILRIRGVKNQYM